MKEYNAIDIANWFINKANSGPGDDEGNYKEGISNLKLQKLLYFAQAACLAVNKKALFYDEVTAWKYGPVVISVYQEFKEYENRPIDEPSSYDFKNLDVSAIDFLENIWEMFGKFSAARLVDITHQHSPWREAFQSSNSVITKQSLKDYYKNFFQKV